MQQLNQRRGAIKKWLLLVVGVVATGIGIAASGLRRRPIWTPAAPFNNPAPGAQTRHAVDGAASTGVGTTGTTTTTQPRRKMPDDHHQPIQYDARLVSTRAFARHRIQNAIAAHNGTLDTLPDHPRKPNPAGQHLINALGLIKTVTDLVAGLSTAIASSSGLPPLIPTTLPSTTTGDGTSTISNPATTGAGTSTPIQ
jgi:hypothetical protein